MGKVHSFKDQLEFSQRSSCETFWDAIYRKAFPDLVNHSVNPSDNQGQRLGIDRYLHLSSGRVIKVDEKKRRSYWEDIALETVSNTKTCSPGWMNKDLQIDYLAYAFMDVKLVHLFPWDMLRRAWLEFREEWTDYARSGVDGYCEIEALNMGYKTKCLCVPINAIRMAVSRATIIQLNEDELEAAS